VISAALAITNTIRGRRYDSSYDRRELPTIST
jgi:hypothetical protein